MSLISRIGNTVGPLIYNSGKLTHLLIGSGAAFTSAQYLSVVLKSRLHDPIVLLNRIPLLALQGISDFEAGASQTLQVAVNEGATNDFVGFFVAVSLGNLDLRATDSVLEITTEGTIANITVAAVNIANEEPDFVEKTLISGLLVDRSPDVSAVFGYYATGSLVPFTDAALDDIAVTITTGQTQSFCTIQDCIGFTAVFGQMESQAPKHVYCLYKDDNPIPDDVAFQISGSDAANLQVIVKNKIYKTTRLNATTVARMDESIRKLDKKSPAKQQSLIAAGVTPPVASLQGARQTVAKIRNNNPANK